MNPELDLQLFHVPHVGRRIEKFIVIVPNNLWSTAKPVDNDVPMDVDPDLPIIKRGTIK